MIAFGGQFVVFFIKVLLDQPLTLGCSLEHRRTRQPKPQGDLAVNKFCRTLSLLPASYVALSALPKLSVLKRGRELPGSAPAWTSSQSKLWAQLFSLVS
jgi:hypothetical protein